jgi:uncharacterized MAPEG superfamily protein
MTIPLWCLLVAIILPYVWFVPLLLVRQKQFGSIDFKLPRQQYAKLEGVGARVLGAHQNSFEALAVFAPAVLVAHITHADPEKATMFAVAWVVLRVLHGIFYIANINVVRTGCFGLAYAAAAGLFVISASAPSVPH